MPVYQSDNHVFILSIIKSDGTAPSVTSSPTITIINARTAASVISAQSMTLVSGTQAIYTYLWTVAPAATNDDYFSIVSYAADGITITNRFLERVRVGDTRISGLLALDATVAKDSTVAKDTTVAKAADLAAINPNSSTAVLAIKAKTDLLPADPASQATITSLSKMSTDIRDSMVGKILIDRTVTPATMTIYHLDNATPLATFTLTEDSNQTLRTRTGFTPTP
jgi:hypothetical protein